MPIHPFRFAVLVLVLVLSPLSQADTDPTVALRNLHAAELNLYTASSAFHRYQSSEGDSKLLVKLNETLGNLKTAFQACFQDLTDQGLTTELDQIKGHWKQAARDLNSAMTAISGRGFAEGQIINDYLLNSLYTTNDLKSAYKAVAAKAGIQISPVLQSLRNESALFKEMSALYIEQSTTQYGYTYRSTAEDNDTLDKMAQRFTNQLDAIEKQLAGNSDAIKKLNHVRNKWQFLEKSFLNYTENSVPYLVEKFGDEIVANLEALAAEYDNN